jgi:hypothetical protein
MASKVSIANLALTILGADRITSLDDNAENARRLSTIFDSALEDVLRAHPWNFAIVRAQLALLATTPTFEYDYEYQLPGNCLRVISVSDGTNIITDFKIEGRKLLCDETTVYIKYIANITDPNQYTSQFIYVLATRLAAEIAYATTNNKATAEEMFQLYVDRLRIAKETDAQESNSVETIDEDLWTIDKRI